MPACPFLFVLPAPLGGAASTQHSPKARSQQASAPSPPPRATPNAQKDVRNASPAERGSLTEDLQPRDSAEWPGAEPRESRESREVRL